MKRSSKSKMSLPKKIFLWVFGILVILAIVAVVYVAAKIFITGNKIHNPLDRNHSELRDKKVSLNDGDPFTIALFGVDSDADRKKKGGGERSDSIMILSINPKTKKTEIVSIPRDTRAEIVGRGTTEKIAHAYAYGGPNMAVKSLEKLMNVPIDHYATIDMDGLHNMIDSIGGVDVVSNDTFTVDGVRFTKGQQIVLEAMANKIASPSSITHFNSLMNEIQNNVKTDLTLGDLNTIRSNYKDANDTINKHQLSGQGGIQSDGLYYFIPSEQSKAESTKLLKDNLE